MKVTLWHSTKPRERLITEALAEGIRTRSGDTAELRELKPEVEVADCDVAVIFGVKGREIFRAHWKAGVHTVHIDKGYIRRSIAGPVKQPEYWRVSIDGHHPTPYLAQMKSPPDRWQSFGMDFAPWRKRGDHIVYAGSSAKYHTFAGLPDPTFYAERLIFRLRKLQKRRIIYRPKPSWGEAVPVAGADYSRMPERLADILMNAHALVTNGSNSCFEAVLAGIPCIILGEAVAGPISSTELEDIERPRLAADEERFQWFSDLAYCQWTLEEMMSGQAWEHARKLILVGVKGSQQAWS